DGYVWLVPAINLNVSDEAIRKRAGNEGWATRASLKAVVERAHAKADAKVGGTAGEKDGEPTTDEAIDLRAAVIEKHREEWGEHRRLFTLEGMLGEEGLGVARVAKTAAEAIKIRQEGERKAWGLDAISEDTGTGVATLEQLDAMFA